MAIDELLDEHEQSERVRSWLRSNAGGLLGGILLGLALVGGWQWWQKHRQGQLAQASERFDTVIESLEAGDATKAKGQADALENEAYATLAALAMAKAQVEAGEPQAAIATLRAARGKDADLDPVVEQRLARLLVDAGKPDEALELLADASGAGALEARGDAEFAAGKRDAARESYQKALAATDVASPQRRLLELKLADAGGKPADSSTAAPEADAPAAATSPPSEAES